MERVSVWFSYVDVLSWFLKTASGFYGCANEVERTRWSFAL